MKNSLFLPLIISASIVGGLLFLRGGYVAYKNVNDPEENYQSGSKYMDNSILTGFWGSGGGKKTRYKKHKKGKKTRRK